MVTRTDAVLYVPRDHRRKTDRGWNRLRHLSDLLTVSKNFVTPSEFAFAVLSTAVVKFRSSRELRRLLDEVSATTKQFIRKICLNRVLTEHTYDGYFEHLDLFEKFTSMAKVLSEMPELKQIHISMDSYCVEIGKFLWNHIPIVSPTRAVVNELIHYTLACDKEKGLAYAGYRPYYDQLSQIVTAFTRDRTKKYRSHHLVRPHAWVRRLIHSTEGKGIEVIFDINLCVRSGGLPRIQFHYPRFCYSDRDAGWCSSSQDPGYMHFPASMSTRDWLLKVNFENKEYAIPQEMARDMLHAPARGSFDWWVNFWESHGNALDLEL